MDSSPKINPKKPMLVVGSTTNPKPYVVTGPPPGFSSKPGLKRYSDDRDSNNLAIKKSRTVVSAQDGKKIVALDVKPLAIVEADTPRLSRQFWKAGDDNEDEPVPRYCSNDAAVRVHPQFLHANATSHKWALGALAELLDNSLDEVCNGATYVHVNSATNEKDGKSSILIVEDNGGGMDPGRFRECLSLGYSRKRNMANKVGQYGNGFKTSTMRLGADAIVFSRCRGTNGNKTTQSIGMLSYTFLYETRKCEAIVPTVDFELVDNTWKEITYNSTDEWFDNLETIVKWSPYSTQDQLFEQFDHLEEQGTRIVIYNLWDDDEGKLELDFDTDPHDIQLRGVNRDEKNIEMAKTYPNSRHFLTYRHSLRSYVSILYLRLPPNFKIILRGKEVEHHSLLDDMMMTEDKTYRPVRSAECSSNEEMVADLKLGFVKDAHHHIDIQGFNVYHKNRLIKPFWRVWNAAGSDGRGVIGLVEANFIQPAHNKQGFERTAVLAKLENRLLSYQKTYWTSRCHEIGYAPRRKQANHVTSSIETTRQGDKKSEVPFNNVKHDKGPSSNAAPARFMQNGQSSGGNQLNSQGATQPRVVGDRMIPDNRIKIEKHGHGTSFNEARSVNQAAELQKVKDESAKHVAELQRQRGQLESQNKQLKAKIQDLEKSKDDSQKLVSKLLNQLKQSAAKIQDMEKTQKVTDNNSGKLVVELSNQLKQSNSKIQDLEKTQKFKDDESAKLVNELKIQKALLEEGLKKVRDGSTKLVDELQREKAMLEEESHKLKQSEAKIQDLEKSQIEVTAIFQEERARRDVIEHDLRKMLRVSPLPKQIYGIFNYLHSYSFHFGKRYRNLLIPSVR
ncbi:protein MICRORCHIDIA 5 [Brassica napus]|uniref:protein MICRORCHIDIA 5 n=1 Tax=Brassica napus TaxID=3708 RepID=UPI0020787033|nr:protein MICRORCHIDIA 5 [Brassica napus]